MFSNNVADNSDVPLPGGEDKLQVGGTGMTMEWGEMDGEIRNETKQVAPAPVELTEEECGAVAGGRPRPPKWGGGRDPEVPVITD